MATLRATAAGQVLTGTDGTDYLVDVAGGDTLIGGAGNDTYYIYDSRTQMVEQPGGGNDTVFAYVSDQAPANVENLNVGSPWITGIANSAGTTMSVLGEHDTLVGGIGNDTMTNTGVHYTTFEFAAGGGRDTIVGFVSGSAGGHDSIRLDNFGFTDFSQIKPLLSQAGSDVLLTLSASDSVLIKNTALSSLSAANFELQLDMSNLKPTFSDDFNSLSLWDPNTHTGTWQTTYPWGARTFPSNGEIQLYVDPSYQGTAGHPLGLNPFSINNGVLTITASQTPQDLLSSVGNYPYISGELNNSQVFTQQYGYFEMRAQLPSAPGTWPTFWMLQPADHTGETDVMEMFGSHDSYSTALSSTLGYTYRYGNYIPDSDTSFHNYGVLWTPTTMTFYVDRVAIGSTATPSDMQGPMYMIMNLAMGGSAGSPSPDLTSAQMKIDYVHAYSLGGGGGTPGPDTVPPAIAFNGVSFVDTGTPGDNTTKNGAVTFSGTVSDNVGVASIDVFSGTTLLGHAAVDNTAHTWSFSTTLGNGVYDHVTAVATDLAGNAASGSAPQSLHVDTLPPSVTFGALSSTNNPAVTFSGTVSDDTSVAGVDVFNGSTLLGHATVDSIAKTWDLSMTLANGTYNQLAATATDEAGNTATAAAGQSITITIDTVAPSPAINSDIRNGNGSFTLAGPSEAGSSVSIYDSGKLLGTSQASSSGSWSFTSAPLANAVHDFTVSATDPAGNVGQGTSSAIYGTTGKDVITSSTGNELLTGAGGADTFVFSSSHFGTDVITDFSTAGRNHDVVQFSQSVFADYSSVMAHATQSGGNVVIHYDAADAVTLLGVHLNKLVPDDFQLV